LEEQTENRELTTDHWFFVILLTLWFPCSSPPRPAHAGFWGLTWRLYTANI